VDYAAAATAFEQAAGSADVSARIEALRWRGQTLGFSGDAGAAVEAFEEAIGLTEDPEQRRLLEATRDFYALGWFGDPDWRGRSAAIQARAAELEGRTAGERRALSVAAFDIARTGAAPAARSIELADRVRAALATWLDSEPGIETPAGIGESSIICEDPNALARHGGSGHSATRSGMTVMVGGLHTQLADIRLRRGDLLDAEADARLAAQLLQGAQDAAPMNRWWALATLVAALTARGALEEAEELVLATGIRTATVGDLCVFPWTPVAPVVLGELEIACGRTADGIERLLRDGAWLEDHGWANPALNPWRARVTPALAAAGRLEEAREMIAPALERGRAFGAPWALGMALRAAGVARQGTEGISLLRESIEVLEAGGCRVEHAHALVELGAALRRRNSRAEAREHLRLALDIATRAGAQPLAARAREELAATGARPRRELLTGVQSLTASERRVADLAAGGRSNPEIAQALFVTRKTVEAHLRSVYMKLDVTGRGELSAALKD
jgi:DNA-binding CsgD family transcriptional regulator